ncbi:MAG: VCBS repeat-containing protein [Bryobacteraceae bacterium]|jgi:hypothetical protein
MRFRLVGVTVAPLVFAWCALGQSKLATFAVPPEFNAGISTVGGTFGTRGPYPGLTADLNHDGYDDFVTVDQTAGTVVVVLGGSKGFQTPRSFPGIQQPRSIAVGDFNNDGNLDIVVVGSSIGLLLGTGTGSFGPPIVISNSTARYVAVGDFNGDGKLDLALAAELSNQVLVALGNGDGTFGRFVSTTVKSPWALYPGTFHNNGLSDLLLIGGGVFLLTSNGDGTFRQGPPIGTGAWGLAVADMNRDGNQDFVSIAGPGTQVQVWLGDGKGNFAAAAHVSPEGNDAYYVAAADVNGDGIPDVVTANLDASVSILLGNGDGTLQRNYSYKANSGTVWVGVGAYFGADRADLAALNSLGNSIQAPTVSLLRNDGSGHFPGLQNIPFPNQASTGGFSTPVAFALADMNQDGNLDLVAADPNPSGTSAASISILPGSGKGAFGRPIAVVPVPAGALGPVVADFNGDGKPDFAVNTSFGLAVGLQQTAGTYQVVTTYAGPGTLIWAGDLNGDGFADLVMLYAHEVYVLLGNGDGTFQTATEAYYGANYVAVADFNNDGKPDLAANGSSGPVVLLGNGDGTFGPPIQLQGYTGGYPIAIGDFNNDGNQDLVTVGSGILVFLGDGHGGFRALPPQPFQIIPAQMTAVDLNGDGHLDLAWVSGNSIQIYLGDGTGTLRSQRTTYYASGGDTVYVQAGDINGDGKIDLVCLGPPFSMLINTSK